MNKSELVQMLSNRTKMTKADASRAVEALFNPDDGIITSTLRGGDRVQITGFGTFETRERKARTGRNPRTGREIKIGPTTSASFRPGKALKDSVKPGGTTPGSAGSSSGGSSTGASSTPRPSSGSSSTGGSSTGGSPTGGSTSGGTPPAGGSGNRPM